MTDPQLGSLYDQTLAPLGPLATPAPSGAALVEAALQSSANLDFPQVTEICERLEAAPGETSEAVLMLAAALSERCPHPRITLRALTISNELMYNGRAVSAFRSAEGLQETLVVLRAVTDAEFGAVTGGNIRMLATEVEKACFSSNASETQPVMSSGERMERSKHTALRTFEMARRKAEKTWDKTASKASLAMEKTERFFDRIDRTASNIMQEAERTLREGFAADASSASSAPAPRAEVAQRQRGRQEDAQGRPRDQQLDLAALEEEQLQWALSASLAESRGQATVRGGSAADQGGHGDVLRGQPLAEVLQQTREAEARAEKAERALDMQATLAAAATQRDGLLLQELRSSDSLVAGLRAGLARANEEMAQVASQMQELEAQVAGVKGGAALERRLRAQVERLEAERAQGDRAAAP